MKKILAIGGSYFAGRVFSILCSRDENIELHVVNRGNAPLGLPNVTEHRAGRRDTVAITETLQGLDFDAVIDFCAYQPGDIKPLLTALAPQASHYIFISTTSVYAVGKTGEMTEEDPVIPTIAPTGDPNTDYVINKVKLEEELKAAGAATGMPWTIIRPSFIYGPYNYAPREPFYIQQLAAGKPLPFPIDASGKFQMIYVTDLARALIECAGSSKAYSEIFNLAAPDVLDNERIFTELEKLSGKPIERQNLTVSAAMEQGIPIPFPTLFDELYSGKKFAEKFGFSYTSFEEGFLKTYNAFK